jgi:hypothetical protein
MNSNPNPIAGLLLLAMVISSVVAIMGAKSLKWKLLNFLIILGFLALGVGFGAVAGEWAGNSELGGHMAAAIMSPFGLLGAFGCRWQNKRRAKGSEVTVTK